MSFVLAFLLQNEDPNALQGRSFHYFILSFSHYSTFARLKDCVCKDFSKKDALWRQVLYRMELWNPKREIMA